MSLPAGHTVYIGLGTNIGDRLANLEQARLALAAQMRLQAASPVYETPPWGYLDQPAFLNQVVKADTNLAPDDLLAFLKRTEVELGRQPSLRYRPRLIDLDILFYDDLVLDAPTLTIPHPRLPLRGFVLVPLADLAPGLRHPVTGQTVREMLALCDARGIHPFTPGSDQSTSGGPAMSETEPKPLHWTPVPGIGYRVSRRPDGGMNIEFSDVSPATLAHWREFALEHLLDSDRLTRNLYDLRQVVDLPEEAIQYAIEVNNDPSVRNIRLAVVVANEQVRHAVHQIADLTAPGGVEMAIFTDLQAAEAWLSRPLTLVV